MEWLSQILTSSNAVVVLSFLLIFTLIGIVLVKKGLLSFNGKGVKLGVAEQELGIVRSQMQYINTTLDATIRDLPPHLTEGLHYYRSKYIISKVKDLFEEMVIYNHISPDENYIELKQEIVYNSVMKLISDEWFKRPEFKEYMYKLTDRVIKRLYRIRAS